MTDANFWWLLAGILVAVELITGVFFLLMLALAAAAAAMVSYLGWNVVVQVTTAAIVGGGAVAVWRLLRKEVPQAISADANPDVNLDIGQSVYIDTWQADDTASIFYRGANWTAQLQAGSAREAGNYLIAQVIGSRLIVKKV